MAAATQAGKVLLLLLLLSGIPESSAQTDSTLVIPADTVATGSMQQETQPGGEKPAKLWAVSAAIATLLISSYLLYNVRSR